MRSKNQLPFSYPLLYKIAYTFIPLFFQEI